MANPTIYFMRGIPASGKTTWAKNFVAESDTAVRVNKDDIRKMLFGDQSRLEQESFVVDAERYLVRRALASKIDVVVDNTHLNPYHEKEYRQMADFFDADFKVILMQVDVDEAIRRDSQRENPVGEGVIRVMYQKAVNKGYL